MDAVALQHIKKSYTSYSSEIVLTGQTRQSRTRQVLRDLSVCFPIGQLTVIVGRSGCGKSTLLKLLAGKEQPDAGQIEMPQGWHSALLSPDPYVITWTNVQRNVAMACGVGKTPEERYEKAADFVRLVGRPHPSGAFHGHEAAAGPCAGAGQSGAAAADGRAVCLIGLSDAR